MGVRRREREPRLLSLGIRIGINAAALWFAATLIGGFDIVGWPALLVLAAILTVVNTFVAPVARLLGCPLTMATLGLFLLIINTAMLALTVWLAQRFDVNVALDGFGAAFFAALVVSVVSWVLNIIVGAPLRRALR
jgi:putative membrane protein